MGSRASQLPWRRRRNKLRARPASTRLLCVPRHNEKPKLPAEQGAANDAVLREPGGFLVDVTLPFFLSSFCMFTVFISHPFSFPTPCLRFETWLATRPDTPRVQFSVQRGGGHYNHHQLWRDALLRRPSLLLYLTLPPRKPPRTTLSLSKTLSSFFLRCAVTLHFPVRAHA